MQENRESGNRFSEYFAQEQRDRVRNLLAERDARSQKCIRAHWGMREPDAAEFDENG